MLLSNHLKTQPIFSSFKNLVSTDPPAMTANVKRDYKEYKLENKASKQYSIHSWFSLSLLPLF